MKKFVFYFFAIILVGLLFRYVGQAGWAVPLQENQGSLVRNFPTGISLVLEFVQDYKFWVVSLFVWSVISFKSTLEAYKQRGVSNLWMSIASLIVVCAIAGNLTLEAMKYLKEDESIKQTGLDITVILQASEYLMQIIFAGAFLFKK